MKKVKFLLGLCLMTVSSAMFAQGLQGIVVERYYQTNAADAAEATANGAVTPLTVGSTVYRVYVDMNAGYEFVQLFGSASHNLSIGSTANFYNDPTFGVATNPASINFNSIRQETAWIDSYLTAGGTYNGAVGVLKSEDTNGSIGHATGLLANNAGTCWGLPITGAGSQDGMVASSASTFVTPNTLGLASALGALDQTAGNSVLITNGALASLGGIVGATSSNMVLIGQFTTSGELTFQLNVQLLNTATGNAETYVASNPVGGELTHPSLTRVANVAPVVAITSPSNGASFNVGNTVTINATASDANGTVSGVEFFVDGVSVGVDNTAPYSATYVGVLGPRVLTAVATDNDCTTTTSSAVNIVIANAPVGAPANDTRAGALTIAGGNFPVCGNNSGNLTNASNSNEALTTEPIGAGQDVWYQFVALTNGVRIQANSTACNLVLELQNASGTTLIASENETATGGEVLIANNLTPGTTYYLAIRNFSTTSVGSFTYCIQHLRAPQPDNGTSFSSLCGFIKSRWTGANLYTVTFTNGPTTISASSSSTQIPFSSFAGLQYNTVYQVVFTSTFNQVDAGGNPTQVVVNSAPISITIAPHTPVNLRSIDRCPTSRSIGAFIGTDINVCGITEWEWEFQEVDAQDVVIAPTATTVESNTTSRFIRVSSIPGVQPGDYYRVRVRPVFASGPGTFANNYFLLCVAGAGGMITEPNVMAQERSLVIEGEVENNVFALYPNPNKGETFQMVLESGDHQIRITDAMGRVVFTNRYVVEGTQNVEVVVSNKLASGLYNVESINGETRQVARMIVE